MAEEFDTEQRELSQLWKKARKDGCMAPWQQAKVFGLKEAWQEIHGEKTYGQAAWIAERVFVQGHPQQHPTASAVRQLLKKMDNDEDWFPGKVTGSLGGRPAQIPLTNKVLMAKSAMAMKERGIEPTYALVIAQCPNASLNPVTGEAVSKRVVYDIFRSRCYDIDPEIPWSNQKRLAKVAVLPQFLPVLLPLLLFLFFLPPSLVLPAPSALTPPCSIPLSASALSCLPVVSSSLSSSLPHLLLHILIHAFLVTLPPQPLFFLLLPHWSIFHPPSLRLAPSLILRRPSPASLSSPPNPHPPFPTFSSTSFFRLPRHGPPPASFPLLAS